MAEPIAADELVRLLGAYNKAVEAVHQAQFVGSATEELHRFWDVALAAQADLDAYVNLHLVE